MHTYHATSSAEFQPESFHNSRYGFPVLFSTTSFKLARAYREWNQWKHNAGYIYAIEHPSPDYTHQFKNKITYNNSFRNLIYDIRHKNVSVVHIKNTLDTPDKRIHHHVPADLYAILDIDRIKNTEIID